MFAYYRPPPARPPRHAPRPGAHRQARSASQAEQLRYFNYFTEELSTRPVLCHTREDREHKVPAASFDILIIIYTIFYPPYML